MCRQAETDLFTTSPYQELILDLALLGETLVSPRDTDRSTDVGKPANIGTPLRSELYNDNRGTASLTPDIFLNKMTGDELYPSHQKLDKLGRLSGPTEQQQAQEEEHTGAKVSFLTKMFTMTSAGHLEV